MDKISVNLCMICWDRLKYTQKAIESVLKQTFKDFTLTIVDNGSKDGTVEYLKSLKDPRIDLIFNEENEGLSVATNQALSNKNAEFVGRVDNDIVFPEEWLERCVKAHESYDNFGFIGGMHFFPYHLMDIKPRITEYNGIQIWEKPYIGGCSFIIRRKDLEKFGPIGSGEQYFSKVMGLTEYQQEFYKAGKVNGYLYPFIWVDHMEHPNSTHCEKSLEYDNYSIRVRNVGHQDYGSSFDRDSQFYLRLNTE